MAVLIVNDRERRVEYTAQAAETTFVYDWSIFADGDLDVYKDQLLLILNTDYTVTGAGVTDGGDVILNDPAIGGESIIIVGDLAIDQTSDFTIKANFTGQTIQTQFNKLTMIAQELDTKLNQRGLLYNTFADLRPNNQDNILPQLGVDQFWKMNAAGTGITAASFEVDPGANTLRSELISGQSGSDGAKIVGYFSPLLGETFVHDFLARVESQTNGSDGASAVGYFDANDSTSKTVKTKLDELTANVAQNFRNLIIGGDFTTNPFQRGAAFNPVPTTQFVADRFQYIQSGSMVLKSSQETATPPPPAQTEIFVNKYVRLEVTTGALLGAGDFVLFGQKVEGFNWTRLAQRIFSLSFWVRSSITGTFGTSFRNVDATLSYVSNFTIDSVDTWEKKTIIIAASPSAGNWNYEEGLGVDIQFCLAAEATFQTATLNSWESGNFVASTTQTNFAATTLNTFDFALIQAEEGDSATSFEVRHFSEELGLCQRYYWKSYSTSIPPGTVTTAGAIDVLAFSGGGLLGLLGAFHLPVALRAVVTPTTWNPRFASTQGSWASGGAASSVATVVRANGQQSFTIGAANTSFVAGENYLVQLTADAEL